MQQGLFPPSSVRGWPSWWKPLLFLLVAAAGLYYVKWSPYYLKSFVAADTHSIGNSILADGQDAPLAAALAYARVYFLAIWKAAALALVLGSLLQVLIPRDWLLRLLGGPGIGPALRGGLLALPGMMCSCCAAPIAAAMRRQQVSTGAALAFWIGNPVLNPATLVFMGFVLGWGFAALRLVAGIAMVLGAALLGQRLAGDAKVPEAMLAPAATPAEESGSFMRRWLHHLLRLFWNTVPIYILAVLLLGAARVWLFPHAGGFAGEGLGWLVLLAGAGTLFVIPTAAEIPIVQAMMSQGLATGSAVALLMTLPAISLPALLILRKAFDARVLVAVTVLTALAGVAAGLAGTALLG